MYIRDFRASILAWKDYEINTKTLKILVILLILYLYTYFLLLFGCTTTNFGPLFRGQPHSRDHNHWLFKYST